MKIYKKRELIKNLTKKGFKENRSGDHITLIFYVDGKPTSVRTKISHGGGEPGKDLLSRMRRDLNFDTQSQFENFVDCYLSEQQFISILKNKKIITE
jgi:hypothetical protein